MLEHIFHFASTSARSGYQNFVGAYEDDRKAGATHLRVESTLQRPDGFVIRIIRVHSDGQKEDA